MKKGSIAVGLFAIIMCLVLLAGCQKGWEEKKSVSIKADDAEQQGQEASLDTADISEIKQAVSRFSVSEEKTIPEMIEFFNTNLAYTEDPYKSYIQQVISFYERMDNALEKWKEGYTTECAKHLSEKGCYNAMDPAVMALLVYPKETIQKLAVTDATETKAAVQVVTGSAEYKERSRAETYYLKKTEDGWKIYDVFDYNAKKAISDVALDELERDHNLQVFRLRAKLEDVGFDGEKYDADVCVSKLGKDYEFTSDNNKNALDCYKTEYFDAAKESGDTSHCRMIFPVRYNAICYGMTYATTGLNCSILVDKPAYRSDKYGYLTTEDVCNFYYSMELSSEDLNKAIANCVEIKSKAYAERCVQALTPQEETEPEEIAVAS
ncbi:TPA: hypothetical protein HA265_07530 [Candidatus Woesearchaeota archaeon]|nr:hypothetical protein [Candidatus Woesearchaeota archaeon]